MNHETCEACENVNLLQQRVEQLEQVKTDMETRLRKLERAIWMGTGMMMTLQVLLKFVWK